MPYRDIVGHRHLLDTRLKHQQREQAAQRVCLMKIRELVRHTSAAAAELWSRMSVAGGRA